MRKLLIVILILNGFLALGQSLHEVYQERNRVRFRLEVATNGKLQLSDLEIGSPGSQFDIESCRLVNGTDLEIRYRVPELKRFLFASTQLDLNSELGVTITPNRPTQEEPLKGSRLTALQTQTLRWADFLEDAPGAGISYELRLEQSILAPFSCSDPPPRWNNLQFSQNAIVAIAGIGMLHLGNEFRDEVEQRYEEYRQAWNQGLDATVGTPLFMEIERNRNLRDLFLVLGTTTLVGDAIWYYFRNKRIKAKRKLYDDYCESGITQIQWQPKVIPLADSFAFGGSLHFNF